MRYLILTYSAVAMQEKKIYLKNTVNAFHTRGRYTWKMQWHGEKITAVVAAAGQFRDCGSSRSVLVLTFTHYSYGWIQMHVL